MENRMTEHERETMIIFGKPYHWGLGENGVLVLCAGESRLDPENQRRTQ